VHHRALIAAYITRPSRYDYGRLRPVRFGSGHPLESEPLANPLHILPQIRQLSLILELPNGCGVRPVLPVLVPLDFPSEDAVPNN
jgi:hypothetical protein